MPEMTLLARRDISFDDSYSNFQLISFARRVIYRNKPLLRLRGPEDECPLLWYFYAITFSYGVMKCGNIMMKIAEAASGINIFNSQSMRLETSVYRAHEYWHSRELLLFVIRDENSISWLCYEISRHRGSRKWLYLTGEMRSSLRSVMHASIERKAMIIMLFTYSRALEINVVK